MPTLRCRVCGNTERFIAYRECHGVIRVVVDGDGRWQDDLPPDRHGVHESSLEWDGPQGPYQCAKCLNPVVEVADP